MTGAYLSESSQVKPVSGRRHIPRVVFLPDTAQEAGGQALLRTGRITETSVTLDSGLFSAFEDGQAQVRIACPMANPDNVA